MHRRKLLQSGVAALAYLGASGRLWAAPITGPRLLVVFLRGGYDANNFLVPYSSGDYYEMRPTISIPKPDPSATGGAMKLDGNWALAPAVRETMGQLYTSGQAAFIPFSGTEDLSRSHFETQDSIELGRPSGATRNYRSGFLARLAETLDHAPAISFTDALPLILAGPVPLPNLSLKNVGKSPFDQRQARILSDLYAGTSLQSAIDEGFELRQEVAQSMADEMRNANRDSINTKGFELEAERMGHLMAESYRIGFIDVGGWDTHVNEGAGQGALATNLDNLSRGLISFSRSLGTQWNNTVVVVVSEFGRTFRENGNHGTDHGHGSVYWVLGGAIRGGRIVGEQVPVKRSTLFQDRDFPVLNDYRAIFGGLFRRLWGLSQAQCEHIFPQVSPSELGLV